MNSSPKDTDRRAQRARKWRDAAAVLTVVGVIIFASPLVSAVGSGTSDGPVPLAVQYIFNTWAVLIAAAFCLWRFRPSLDDPEGAVNDHTGTGTGASPE